MSKKKSKIISIRLEGPVLMAIEEKARKECRSVTQQIRKIIQNYAMDKSGLPDNIFEPEKEDCNTGHPSIINK